MNREGFFHFKSQEVWQLLIYAKFVTLLIGDQGCDCLDLDVPKCDNLGPLLMLTTLTWLWVDRGHPVLP